MSQDPDQPLTPAHVAEWIHHASLKRWQLLLNATVPSQSERAQALAEMDELCQDAIEEVRVISAQLQEESEAVRKRSADLRARSNELLARSTTLAESQLLQIFTGKPHQGERR